MKCPEPYRVFFPFGILFGIVGISFWLLAGTGHQLTSLFQVAHADIMMGGFLLLFSTGFLMTAVPKFSGTFAASSEEIGLMFATTVALFVSIGVSPSLFYLLALVQVLQLVFFASRRIPKRTRALPTNFVFVPLGLFCALIGAVFLLLGTVNFTFELRTLGKLLFQYGMMHCLVLGVGSLLIPAILGFGPLPLSSVALKEWTWGRIKVPYILAVALLSSFLVEDLIHQQGGRGLRFVVVSFVALVCWRIYSLPKVRSTSAWLVWTSAWAVFVGNFLAFAFPEKSIAAIHFTFIGGFSLLTLAVATRVVLAHGGHGLEAENSSRILVISGICILAATLLRVGVDVFSSQSVLVLNAAALFWIAGFLLWSFRFLRIAILPPIGDAHFGLKANQTTK